MHPDHGTESRRRLLYVRPRQQATVEPLIDHLTRKMAAAFRLSRGYRIYHGVHECSCGARSTAADYLLPGELETNSLCVHYLAHHRPAVDPGDLEIVAAFTHGEVEPTAKELYGPGLFLARSRDRIERGLGAERLDTWRGWGLDVGVLAEALRIGPSNQRGPPSIENLLSLLVSIEPECFPALREAVELHHGDMLSWGRQALRLPDWDRALWVRPITAVIESASGNGQLHAAAALRLLGEAILPAAPILGELRRNPRVESEALREIERALRDHGVPDDDFPKGAADSVGPSDAPDRAGAGSAARGRGGLHVYLDDELPAPTGWIGVRWPEDAIRLLETGKVTHLSLEHDLGDDARGTGSTVLKWIEEAIVVRGFVPPVIALHTRNPSARVTMELAVRHIRRLTESARSGG